MAIVNRIDQLVREKAVEWQRDITWSEVADATGIAESTFSRMRADPRGIRFSVLNAICRFFDCDVCDVLVYVPDEPDQGERASAS